MVRSLKEKRWHKATLISWLLQVTPFIRFIGVTGSMAHDIIRPSSDIDIFIIAKEKRLWTCRFFSRALLRILGQLRTGDKFEERSGKICPNRYVSDKYLIINPQNEYHAQDYVQMIPLFDNGKYYHQFIVTNSWMEEYGYFRPQKVLNLVHSNTLTFFRKTIEQFLSGKYGESFEQMAYKRGLKNIKRQFPNLNKPNSSIIANNNEIRIHTCPR